MIQSIHMFMSLTGCSCKGYPTFIMSMMEYVELYSDAYIYYILIMCQSRKIWKNTPGLKSHEKSSGVLHDHSSYESQAIVLI